MYKFSYFTQRANEALNFAIKSAEEFGHNYVGSEHILLGLLKTDGGIALNTLEEKGITAEDVENLIKEYIGQGMQTKLTPDDFTPRTKRVLDVAFQYARSMRRSFVDTEHLLMAVLQEGDSYAVKFINSFGIDERQLFEELVNVSGRESADEKYSQRKGKNGKSKTPTLDEFGRDLTALAKDGKIDPVIGREKEIERVIQILSRRTKNNPCLIGEPGVGKTAIAEGLALKIVKGEVPELLNDKKIVALDLTSMVAGTKYRGDFEERIKKAMDEVKNAKDIILFIDEVHTLMGAGAAEGATDAANILKPSLARGEIQVIGATTIDEYRKNIEKDAALERRFQPVTVGEPTEEETVQILKGLRDKYEAHHKVKISDEAIDDAVKMSSRYIADRFLPDKAIDLIDEAASRVRLKAYTAPDNIKAMEKEVKSLEEEKSSAVRSQDFEQAAKLRDKQNNLKKLLDEETEKWKNLSSHQVKEVGSEDIAEVVSSWTGIPATQITKEESEKLLHLEDELHKRIVGQDKAVSAVSRAIRRNRAGLQSTKRPPSFIFVGPTGVGKTELAKSLAYEMFGSEDSIIRVDMSEYMESHSTAKLIGAPPGYVGYDDAGQLTEKVKRKPYSIILLDEIEKAHPDVFNILLQVLDDGKLTDSQGNTVSFQNTIIIMTSNAGSNLNNNSIGFAKQTVDTSKIEENLKQVFRPEFLNRIDEIIVFDSLTKPELIQIVELMLKDTKKALAEKNMTLEVSESAKEFILEKGTNLKFGARPLRRAIQRYVEDEISEMILRNEVHEGQNITVNFENENLKFDVN